MIDENGPRKGNQWPRFTSSQYSLHWTTGHTNLDWREGKKEKYEDRRQWLKNSNYFLKCKQSLNQPNLFTGLNDFCFLYTLG